MKLSSVAIALGAASSAIAAFVPGTCCFHLNEIETCESVYDNLYAEILLLDNDKNVVTNITDMIPINVGDYASVFGLTHPLEITGEHENDYVQFTYGDVSWQSKTPNDEAGAGCTVGGWDPREGPTCTSLSFWDQPTTHNQMDCCFPC